LGKKHPKGQPFIINPDPGFTGAIGEEIFPKLTGAKVACAIRVEVVLLRDLGAPLSPFNAFQIIQG
jgi:O-acetylhomoserine sulfhydrylase